MASTRFSAPASGQSSTTAITVSSTTLNTSGGAYTATLTVNNGGNSVNATLIQRSRPTITRTDSGTLPGSGGTLAFSVNSDYAFYFRDNPSNLTDIRRNGESVLNVPSFNPGAYSFSALIGVNSSTATTTSDLGIAFTKLNGTQSYNNPDASLFRISYSQSGYTGETPTTEVRVPIYFDYTGSEIYIRLGRTLPFQIVGSVELTYRQGGQELNFYTFNGGETNVLFADFRGNPYTINDFMTLQGNYVSLSQLSLNNGAPEILVPYNGTDYYIYWSKADSAYFLSELLNVGNDSGDNITWGDEGI